ncbi:MAG: aldehyde dehydrogenase family protein [Verrucomicrobia bacterium]|nr:aldehyde dehydrogenase family protein [Verrucomicrobiota bacterium]MCH8513637.1 aldehyde dehydrogenase family protein [Kiritimatiellia bacterium]
MSLKSEYPLYLANRAKTPNLDLEVVDKYSGEVATRVPLASPALIDEAIRAADKAAGPMAEMKPYERQAVLKHCVKRFT